MRRPLPTIALAIALAAAPTQAAERVEIPLELRHFHLDFHLVPDAPTGGVRLAASTLLTDEEGATDFHQAENLAGRTKALKIFALRKGDLRPGELFFFGAAGRVALNESPLTGVGKLVSTGWTRASVPEHLLREGFNTFEFSGGGQLLIEPGRRPVARSLRSRDGDPNYLPTLGRDGQPGEYLVRLRLPRFAPVGTALSPVFRLVPGDCPSATPVRRLSLPGLDELRKGLPLRTSILASVRTGERPRPDDGWSAWLPLVGPDPTPAATHRYGQLRLELLSDDPRATPRLPGRVAVVAECDPVPAVGRLEVVGVAAVPLTPVAFTYQEASPKLDFLRKHYRLDEVIAPGKTELEQLMLLRTWVRNQWHSAWGSHPAGWMPPWDAVTILASKDQPECLTMCTHYAAVFTQCCLALGWTARHCILDHHCTSEVYLDAHRKWAMLDAGNSAERADVGLHFERNGVPLSALELHVAHHRQATDGIRVVFTPKKLAERIASLCRPAPAPKKSVPERPDAIPLVELKQYPVCQLDNYRRYAMPMRNDYLRSSLPGELYQGWSEYFFDGYAWVGDSPDAPKLSPEYSRHLDPARPRAIDWPVNETRIHVWRTAKPGELEVDLETHTPNLARLEVTEDGGTWRRVDGRFAWKVRPGASVLRARGVNRWDRPGAEARVEVKWEPK